MNQVPFKIAVLDDAFPILRSGFRIEEFNWLIRHLNAHVYSSNELVFPLAQDPYSMYYPENLPYIHPIDEVLQTSSRSVDLLYIVFMCNMIQFLPYIQNLNKPYVFSAYNSADMLINSPETDKNFSLLLNDPLCKGVIVAQKMWYDYLIQKNFCSPDKIKFIYGGLNNVIPSPKPKKRYKQPKNTFDICFTAYLYGPSFIHSKGYDFFIEVARKLLAKDHDFRFHVMGSATPDTIDVSDIRNFIKFYGVFAMKQFTDFYRSMDIMLSATRPTHEAVNGIIQTTADGFPTISAVDAAKCGVFIMVTDLMNNNILFQNNKDICIIPDDVDTAVAQILFYKHNLTLFYNLSTACQQSVQRAFDTEWQMQQRIAFFQQALAH